MNYSEVLCIILPIAVVPIALFCFFGILNYSDKHKQISNYGICNWRCEKELDSKDKSEAAAIISSLIELKTSVEGISCPKYHKDQIISTIEQQIRSLKSDLVECLGRQEFEKLQEKK